MKQKVESIPKYVQKACKKPTSVAAFRGLNAFAKARNISNLKKLEKDLSELEAFSRHRPANKKIARRPIILKRPLQVIQSDYQICKSFQGQTLDIRIFWSAMTYFPNSLTLTSLDVDGVLCLAILPDQNE